MWLALRWMVVSTDIAKVQYELLEFAYRRSTAATPTTATLQHDRPDIDDAERIKQLHCLLQMSNSGFGAFRHSSLGPRSHSDHSNASTTQSSPFADDPTAHLCADAHSNGFQHQNDHNAGQHRTGRGFTSLCQ